ncbi:hypothetical protein [Nitrosomonas communis]|uniref:Uncharacterized protein n=1 Tax=Nitrosomonas communis TaxID=44574 RepID=A0A1I4RQE6_9PROT|nr:hypothetical protein [Nitrosomonas communis]SFM54223.1 hypothetical protein SAMN05421863_103430 [Nitrosomonas communis]
MKAQEFELDKFTSDGIPYGISLKAVVDAMYEANSNSAEFYYSAECALDDITLLINSLIVALVELLISSWRE